METIASTTTTRSSQGLDDLLPVEAQALAGMCDAVVITDTMPIDSFGSPHIVYVNRAFELMTGYSSADVVGKSPRILHGENTSRTELDRIRAALLRLEAIRTELTNYRKDGTSFEVELDIVPLRDASGVVTHFASFRRDVSERKQAEKVILTELEGFKTLAATSPGVLCSMRLRPDGTKSFPYASERCKEILGVTPEEIRDDAAVLFASIHPDDVDLVQSAMLRSASRLEHCRIECRLQVSDGAIRWVKVHSIPVREPDGGTIWYGTATDITHRKFMELSLKRSEATFAAIISSTLDAMICVNNRHEVVVFNAAAERMFGWTAAQMLGQSVDRLIPERFRARHSEYLHGFGRTGVTNRSMSPLTPISGLRNSGEEFPIEVTISQVLIDADKISTAVIRDVTERTRAELALAESLELSNNVLGSVPSTICVLDFSGRIVAVNEAWRKFARENEADGSTTDPIGLNYLDVCLKASDSPEAEYAIPTRAAIIDVLEGRRDKYYIEYPCKSTTEERWFMLTVTPMPGLRKGAVVTHLDITERKLRELRLQQRNEAVMDTLQSLKSLPAIEQLPDQVLLTIPKYLNGLPVSLWLYDPETDTLSLHINRNTASPAQPAGPHALSSTTFSVSCRNNPAWIELIRSR